MIEAMSKKWLNINLDRLIKRVNALGEIGKLEGGGVARLALTDEDKLGRDLVVEWMRSLNMTVEIDQIGNIIATRKGTKDLSPVMIGSHIDTVRGGGLYDGNLGVLAGLEVVETLNEADAKIERPIQVTVFTNEEGSRFTPDMLGSLVFQGGVPLQNALDIVASDGATIKDELHRIGYAGPTPCGFVKPHAYLELHIEQGPVLERKNLDIGIVTGVQGICWTEFSAVGVSNHAGTTPMALRNDPMIVMSAVTNFVHDSTGRYEGHQVGTVGHCELYPNLINVIASNVKFTVDIRNTEKKSLDRAETEVLEYARQVAVREGVVLTHRSLARLDPIEFDSSMIDLVENKARQREYTTVRMPSGAGHDAGIISSVCPTSMIFVPSVNGISHNPDEYTKNDDVANGANVLLDVIIDLTQASYA